MVVALHPLLDTADVLDPHAINATTLQHISQDSVALVGFSKQDDAEFALVRQLCDRGCDVVAYARDWDRATIRLQCRALLAGVNDILDSARPDFASELRERLVATIRKNEQQREDARLVAGAMARFGIVGESAVMQTLSRWILKISPLSDLPVLITGETGTGKELIARAIHGLDPKRSRGPFVPLNCAALGTSLAESELFGHRKGAFTGASKDRRGLIRSADGGTLFLDEIGDLELGLQGALLRVLQENRVRGVGEDREDRVNVRIVAATNRELPALVEQGRFRMDLFYRLNLLTTTAPTLAERIDDIEVLVRHFVHKYAGGRALSPAPSLLAALKAMSLPGNVRQLENLIRHAVVNARGDGTLGIEELPPTVWDQLSQTTATETPDGARHWNRAPMPSAAWRDHC